jgi:hypothetical protein
MTHTPVPILATALAVLALAPRAAHADLDDAQRAVVLELYQYLDSIEYAHNDGDRAADRFTHTTADCNAVIVKAQQAGVAPTEAIDGPNGTRFLFKRAGEKCAEYGRWKLMVDTAVVIAVAQQRLGITKSIDVGEVTGEFTKPYAAAGQACVKAVDAALAAGAPADAKIKVGNEEVTLAEGKTKWCEPVIAWAGQFAAATDKARADAAAALEAKYTKYGIGGDRLAWFTEYDDTSWRVPGCEVEDDIKKLKKAPVLFQWLENSDGSIDLRKLLFKGDKLIKRTDRTFQTEQAAYRGCR